MPRATSPSSIRQYWAFAKTRLGSLRRRRPYVFWASLLVVGAFWMIVVPVALLVIAVWLGAFGALPSARSLADIETPEASYLLDRNGAVLARYYRQNREVAELDELPPSLIEALVATEDARFFSHRGIDWQATARAVVYSVILGQREQGGGSTLSQQLAKQHFPRAGSKGGLVISKIKEAFTANRFERAFTKEELLGLYLNTVDYGENMYGVRVAARRFFDEDVSDLTTTQSAVLVGMLKATSSYNPVRNPERAFERRNLVLRRMQEQGFIDELAYDSLSVAPLGVVDGRDHIRAQTGYLSERAREDIDVLLSTLTEGSADGEPAYDLYSSGLRIYTSIDASLQTMAEDALETTLAELQPKFYEHWRSRDPARFDGLLASAISGSRRYRTLRASGQSEAEAMKSFGESREVSYGDAAALGAGTRTSSWRDSIRAELLRLRAGFVVADAKGEELLAYVGGTDYEAVPYNSATARRQVGSTFKPLVYAAAIERGVQPCEYFPNELRTYTDYKDWTPENSDGEYGGEYSVVGGLVGSVNTVAVQLAFRAGPKYVQELAGKIGLTGVPAEPSIALGTASLSVEDMVRLYGTFARHGSVPTYRLVTRIETRGGVVLYEAEPERNLQQVFSRRTAEVMDYAMRQVALRGTGAGLYSRYGLRSQVAGKTGTTQDQADGWFVGYTRDVVVGAWVGGAYPDIRWRSLSLGQGARTALPIVGRFLKAYERERGVTALPPLPEDVLLDTQCEDYFDMTADSFELAPAPNFAEIFEDLFKRRRDREERREPRGSREQQRREREEANRELAERQRRAESARKDREREQRRESRKERRRQALEKIFGKPD